MYPNADDTHRGFPQLRMEQGAVTGTTMHSASGLSKALDSDLGSYVLQCMPCYHGFSIPCGRLMFH